MIVLGISDPKWFTTRREIHYSACYVKSVTSLELFRLLPRKGSGIWRTYPGKILIWGGWNLQFYNLIVQRVELLNEIESGFTDSSVSLMHSSSVICMNRHDVLSISITVASNEEYPVYWSEGFNTVMEKRYSGWDGESFVGACSQHNLWRSCLFIHMDTFRLRLKKFCLCLKCFGLFHVLR